MFILMEQVVSMLHSFESVVYPHPSSQSKGWWFSSPIAKLSFIQYHVSATEAVVINALKYLTISN